VLGELGRLARRAVLINDLERHWMAALCFRALAPVFARSRVTRHDGLASIRQGFRAEELEGLARAAGLENLEVRLHRPWFRLTLVARRGREPGCLPAA